MNILNVIRRNWLPQMLALLLLTITCSRNFGHHPLSWWNMTWVLMPVALVIWAGSNDWIIFRPIRWWHWPLQKAFVENRWKKLGNPMVYPALIWLEINGKQSFILGGVGGLMRDMCGSTEKLVTALEDAIGAGEKQVACECHNPACGCAESTI